MLRIQRGASRTSAQRATDADHGCGGRYGVPFGRPLHPLMVQVRLGAWISAAVLDVIGGKGNARAAQDPVGVVLAIVGVDGYSGEHLSHRQCASVGLSDRVVFGS